MGLKNVFLAAKGSSEQIAMLSSKQKNHALKLVGKILKKNKSKIFKANNLDIRKAIKHKMPRHLLKRLELNEKQFASMLSSINDVIFFPDPIGEILEEFSRPNGLQLKKISVPLGVVAIIYEARPNVTVDSAVLCIKSGNSVILKGSSTALNTNKVLVKLIQKAISQAGISKKAVQLVVEPNHNSVKEILSASGLIDVVIPRGGANLINFVRKNSSIPVIETGTGICHVFVDKSANSSMAEKIVSNAKCSMPSVCNSAEKLLVHKSIAKKFLPRIAKKFETLGVEIKADKKSFSILKRFNFSNLKKAVKKDFQTEFLDLVMAFAVVDDVEGAIKHINRFGSHHSDAIISEDSQNVLKFFKEVNSAVIFHNASTRFSDGSEFGFGMEIGISTQKLHVRGPFGLSALTSYKYIVDGKGNIRV